MESRTNVQDLGTACCWFVNGERNLEKELK